MNKHRARHMKAINACLLALSLFGATSMAEPLPDLLKIPQGAAPETESKLTEERQRLAGELKVFLSDAEAFNKKTAKEQSDADYNALEARRNQYIAAAKAFNQEVFFLRQLNSNDDRARDFAIPEPPFTNDRDHRSADAYLKAIEQFAVEESRRYKAGSGKTYCNVFARDVVHAMGAELPPETLVNELVDWLKADGRDAGWQRIDIRMAEEMANQGRPTIVIWKNPEGPHGHVAIVRPDSKYDIGHTARPPGGVEVAQAGVNNHNWVMVPEDRVFSKAVEEGQTQYWYHQ
jgi:hypothetical protein